MDRTTKEKPYVKLIGNDGNAFTILGACKKAAKKAGWSNDEWIKVQDEMMEGDYNHLLTTAMQYFEVD